MFAGQRQKRSMCFFTSWTRGVCAELCCLAGWRPHLTWVHVSPVSLCRGMQGFLMLTASCRSAARKAADVHICSPSGSREAF